MFSNFLGNFRKLFNRQEPLAEPKQEPVLTPVLTKEPVRTESPVTPVIEPIHELMEAIKIADSEELTYSEPIEPSEVSAVVENRPNPLIEVKALPKCSDSVACECVTVTSTQPVVNTLVADKYKVVGCDCDLSGNII